MKGRDAATHYHQVLEVTYKLDVTEGDLFKYREVNVCEGGCGCGYGCVCACWGGVCS